MSYSTLIHSHPVYSQGNQNHPSPTQSTCKDQIRVRRTSIRSNLISGSVRRYHIWGSFTV